MASMEQKASVKVSVNGEEAKQELENLQKIAKGLRAQLAEASDAKDWKGAKRFDSDLKRVEKQISRVKRETFDFNEVLSRLDQATPRELRKTLSAINREMNSGNVKRGSSAWNEYQQQAARVKNELRLINQEQKIAEPLITRLGNSVKSFFTSGIGKFAAFTGIGFSVSEAISNYASINDSMIDLKKYTDLTDESLASLQKRFKGLVTSLEIEKLNAYAAEAGKLGESGEEAIYNYTEAAKIIDQGLGADLGADATRNIAKLANLFGEDKTKGLRGAMLATGSAINEVAQSGTSSEGYLVDFTARIGGVAKTLNIAQADIIGFAAVLDEKMQGVERSSTALQDVMLRMTAAPAKYAEIAGMSIQDFTKLLKNDANEALLAFIGGIKNIGDLTDASPVLKELKLSGSGMASTLTSLANNLDAVRERQKLANEAYSEGTSVINEANLAETSATAIKKQHENQIRNLSAELGERLVPIQLAGLKTAKTALQVLIAMIKFYEENRRVINSLVVAIIAYNSVMIIKNKWDSINKGLAKGLRVSQLALAATYNLLTGNISRSAAAMRSLNIIMSVNPYALVIAGIVGVTSAFVFFGKKTDIATEAYKRYTREVTKEKTELDQLIKRFDKAEKGTVAYRIAKDAIQNKYGNYLTSIGLEIDAVHRNAKAYAQLTTEIENAAKARVREQMISEQSDEHAKTIVSNLAKIRARVIKDINYANKSNTEKIDPEAVFSDIKEFMENLDEAPTFENVKDKFEDLGLYWMYYSSGFENIYEANKKLESSIKEINAVLPGSTSPKSGTDTDSDKPDSPDSGKGGRALSFDEKKEDKVLKKKIKQLDAWHAQKKTMEAANYIQGLQSKIEYDDHILDLEQEYLEKKKELYQKGSKEYEEIELQLMSKRVDNVAKDETKERESLTKSFDEKKALIKQNYVDEKIDRNSFNQQMLDEEIKYLRAMAQLYPVASADRLRYENQANELADKDKLAKREEFEQLKKQMQEKYSMQSFTDVFNLEMKALDALHAEKLISEEEYLKAKKALQQNYDEQTSTSFLDTDEGKAAMAKTEFYLSSVITLTGAFNDYMRAETDGQIAAINQKYDAEIRAAGNNQYKLKQIEDKKQKEISAVQAKAADKAMALQMAMALAQTALAALNAYSSTAAIPLVGPALAPIAAGVAVAAGMLNVATIAKQHQAAKKGYYDGGYTGAGRWDEVQGEVHSDEFVANRFAVRNPDVRNVLNVIDTAQRNNTIASLTTADIVSSVGYRQSNNSPSGSDNSNNNSDVIFMFHLLNETVDKLNKRLDEPFVTVNSVEGENGIKQALDAYEATENNKNR